MSARVTFKKIDERAIIPAYQSTGASGFDLHCIEDTTLEAGKVSLVRTGLAVELPNDCEVQIRARSGLAAKAGVFLVNGIGTIDSDYRGEIKIIMSTCLASEGEGGTVELKAGDRIAQGVIARVERAEIFSAEDLTATARGAGGFGSTGVGASC